MSREIQYRAYSTVTGTFDYFTIKELLTNVNRPISEKAFDEDLSIEQFTGLLDCNGVKIFEGDIVRDHNGIGEVQYSDKKAAFKVNYHDGFAKWFIDYNLKGERESIEVIGNIHQNSELLK